MSRAFVREDRPDTEPLPDLPVSPHPNLVTTRGLALLESRLAGARDQLAQLRARPDRLDLMPERAAERDIRYLAARLASAILTAPPPPVAVGFGHIVDLAGADGKRLRFQIVGEDEADAGSGRIAPHAPLARAMIGLEVGDTFAWRRPGGDQEMEILAISLPEP